MLNNIIAEKIEERDQDQDQVLNLLQDLFQLPVRNQITHREKENLILWIKNDRFANNQTIMINNRNI